MQRHGEQMRVQRQRSGNRVPLAVKILISLLLIVGISFTLAWVWHTTQQSALTEPGEGRWVETEAPSQEEPSQAAQAAAPPSEESEESAGEESAPPAAQPLFEGAVPASAAVDKSYFDDAIFFGDSISDGIKLYNVADNAAVVAMTGINTDNINYKKVIDVGGEERVTILEAAVQEGPRKKVYIMLGGNGIGFEKASFIKGYRTFVDSVKEMYPDAVIYLQSMTPVVDDYVNEFDPEMNNQKIDEYNLEILALAKSEQVYYLDVASAFKDENGALPDEASPVDGIHFVPEYYHKWFDYLRTHTVEDKK